MFTHDILKRMWSWGVIHLKNDEGGSGDDNGDDDDDSSY